MLYFGISAIVLLLALVCYFLFIRKKRIKQNYEGTKVVKYKSTINKRGDKDGKEILYDRDGKRNKVSHWKDGKRNGAFTVYWANGKPYIKGTYKDGKLWSNYTVFDRNGENVIFEKFYD